MEGHGAHAQRQDAPCAAVGSLRRGGGGGSSEQETARTCSVVHLPAHEIPDLGHPGPFIEQRRSRPADSVGIGLDEGALVWAIQEENLRGTLKRRAGLPDPFRPVQRNGGRLGEERIQQLVHGATKIHDHPYSTSSR